VTSVTANECLRNQTVTEVFEVTEMATNLVTPTQKLKPQPNLARIEVALAALPRVTSPAVAATAAIRRNNLFSETLLEMSSTRPKRGIQDITISVVFHAFVLVALILPSLYFTDTIDLKGFAQTFLVAPPPPPPPAPMAQTVAKAVAPRRTLVTGGRLLAPTIIPQKVVIIKEEPLPPDIGSAMGVPGGVPGGQIGGVIGGVIGASRSYVPMPTKLAAPTAPLRVGGRVKPPRAIVQRPPTYPTLAKQAQIQGIVSIDAVIDQQGNVVEMNVVSGQPLLIEAALAAVREWKYEPTYLNDQPVAVRLIVRVVFELKQ
jgi:protein TonB